MGTKRNVYMILVGQQHGRTPRGRPGHWCEIIIRWIIERQDEVICPGFIWLRIGTS
jgi:hypothetical protein